MKDDEWRELGRRAVACKGFKWMAGMQPLGGAWRAAEANFGDPPEAAGLSDDAVPDLRDPATLGCLESLARKAQPGGDKLAVVGAGDGGAVVVEVDVAAGTIAPFGEAPTVAEAWVTILEVAS
jgi:hypothetical protein